MTDGNVPLVSSAEGCAELGDATISKLCAPRSTLDAVAVPAVVVILRGEIQRSHALLVLAQHENSPQSTLHLTTCPALVPVLATLPRRRVQIGDRAQTSGRLRRPRRLAVRPSHGRAR